MNHKNNPSRSRRTELLPTELTSAGILAGLTVTLGLSAASLPVFELFFRIAAALPIALVSTRFRWQVTLTSCVAAVGVGLAVGGVPTAVTIAQSALVAWVLGALYRRQVGRVGHLVAATVTAVVTAAVTLGFLLLFSESLKLAVDSLRVTLRGWVKGLGYLPGTDSWIQPLHGAIDTLSTYWWVVFPALAAISLFFAFLLSAAVLRRVILRLGVQEVHDSFSTEDEEAPVAPVPMSVESVTHRYRSDGPDVLRNVSFQISAGEFLIIAGHNGSGKSTLASILAGVSPAEGCVRTPGALGRGRVGGVAYLSQSATAHVVGNTVREDMAWGFEVTSEQQLDQLNQQIATVLERVGLSDLADAQTRHLSGGELQRLALASALIHQPALIISDETTAMIDPAGRRQMMRIFRQLAADGIAVIHITHDLNESAYASRLIRMAQGQVVFDASPADLHSPSPRDTAGLAAQPPTAALGPEESAPDSHPEAPTHPASKKRSLWLRSVTHNVAHRTPWQRTILNGVSMVVEPGECVLITGANGSGKTTLARLLTGLITPTYGAVMLGDRHMWSKVGDISLSHQFTRLQLLRATVGEDILDAVGHRSTARTRERDTSGNPLFTPQETATICAALATVGLDAELATRGVDELSGGQQRRVALAGLIAAEPAALILDEPFAGLDLEARHLLVDVLAGVRRRGTSLILISHDDDGLHALADRHYHLENGRFRGDDSEQGPPKRLGVRKNSFVFPHRLPWSSPLTRMWAGTKILAWAAISTVVLFIPSWETLALSAAYLLVLSVIARVPLNAIPRVPFPLVAGFFGGLIGATLGDGFFLFLRTTAVMVVVFWGTLLLLWTTPTWRLTSAISTLMRPAALLRAPVDSWVHAMALTVKSVPLLLDHMQALQDTMTIRLYRQGSVSTRRFFGNLVDVVTASLSAATRHASIIGVAMSMRGGIPRPTRLPIRWSWGDLALVVLAVVVCCAVGVAAVLW